MILQEQNQHVLGTKATPRLFCLLVSSLNKASYSQESKRNQGQATAVNCTTQC